MRSRWLSLSLSLAALACSAVSLRAADTGTLKLQVVLSGDAPVLTDIKPDKDVEFCGKHKIPDEKLLVDPASKGIKNVVVYVYTGRGGTKLKEVPKAKGVTHVLDNQGCRFEPHIIAVQVGDKLDVTNTDQVAHNANMQFIKNEGQNPQIAAGGKVSAKIAVEEPAPIPVACNIHPWMLGYIIVTDHPYVGISDKDGNIEIKDLPTGELTFRIFAEGAKSALTGIKVDGKSEEWTNNRFKVTIKAGENKLGKVELPAANFK